MTELSAIRVVIKKALKNDGVLKGARECIKAIDRGEARICVLAQDCDKDGVVKLVKAFCKTQKVHLVEVPSRKELGQWCGLLTKYDEDGEVKKQLPASVAVIKDFGEQSSELDFLLNSFKSQ